MNELTVHIDVTSPTGRRIVRDLEKHKRVVRFDNPVQHFVSSGRTLEELYELGLDELSAHYNVDMRKLKSKL